MKASKFFIKSLINPVKRFFKWYFNKMAETGNYICMTGTFPQSYYEWLEEERRRNSKKKD